MIGWGVWEGQVVGEKSFFVAHTTQPVATAATATTTATAAAAASSHTGAAHGAVAGHGRAQWV